MVHSGPYEPGTNIGLYNFTLLTEGYAFVEDHCCFRVVRRKVADLKLVKGSLHEYGEGWVEFHFPSSGDIPQKSKEWELVTPCQASVKS